MANAQFTVNGSIPTAPILLTASSVCTLALVDLSGARTITAAFVGSSEEVTYPTLTTVSRGVVSFTVPTAPLHGFGLSLMFQFTVDGRTSRALLCVGSTNQLSAGETTERGAGGWAWRLNEMARSGASGTIQVNDGGGAEQVSAIAFEAGAGCGISAGTATVKSPTVSTFTALRLMTGAELDTVWLAGHTTAGDGGEGHFRRVAVGSYVDNGGTIAVAGGNAWLRIIADGLVYPSYFGGQNLSDETTAVNAAAAFAAANGYALALPGRTTFVQSLNLVGLHGLRVVGVGRQSVLRQHPSGNYLWPLIDMSDAWDCTLENFTIREWAGYTRFGILMTRGLGGTCQGNKLSNIYTYENSAWLVAPLVCVGCEVNSFYDLELSNGYNTGNGALWFGMNLGHLPVMPLSPWNTFSTGTQSTLDNNFVGCDFSVNVGAANSGCLITLDGPIQISFTGCGFYSSDNATAMRGMILCRSLDAMAGTYVFHGNTFEAANTPVFWLSAETGYPLNYFHSFTVTGNRKTGAGYWVDSANPTNSYAIRWTIRDNSGVEGAIRWGLDTQCVVDTTGGNAPGTFTSLNSTGSDITGEYGYVNITTNFGTIIRYRDADNGWDGSDSHAINRTIYGGNFGVFPQILESTRVPHADSLTGGVGLINHADGTTWSPAGLASASSYPVIQTDDGWVPMTPVIGTPSSAVATGTRGATACDTNYFYVCVATDTWIRIAKDNGWS